MLQSYAKLVFVRRDHSLCEVNSINFPCNSLVSERFAGSKACCRLFRKVTQFHPKLKIERFDGTR